MADGNKEILAKNYISEYLEYYDNKSIYYKRWYSILVVLEIFISAFIPFTALFIDVFSITKYIVWGVIWGKELFVAVGEEGTIITSKDGLNWTQIETGVNTFFHKVIWDGQQYIAVGGRIILTSANGAEWVSKKVSDIKPNNGTEGIISSFLSGIYWDGGKYITGGGGNYILTSTNLNIWTVRAGDSLGSGMYYGFAWNKKRYVAVGDHFDMMTSLDGYNWTNDSLNIDHKESVDDYYTLCLNSVIWGKDRFIAVGQRGLILTSIDGLDWSVIPPVTRASLNQIIWDGKQYTAVGHNRTVITSADGVNWSTDLIEFTAINPDQ